MRLLYCARVVSISTPSLREDAGDVVLEAQIEVPWSDGVQAGQLWFRLPREHAPSPEAAADACFTLGLVLAMSSDGELQMEAPVSRQLVAASEELQDILTSWFPQRLKRARLSLPTRAETIAPAPSGGVSCFTGGVDSFYTAVARSDRISNLVFVHGFDIPLSHTSFFNETVEHLQAAAADLGKPLVTLSTNLKMFTNKRVYWGPVAHGVALASVGTLLHAQHADFLVPATRDYAHLFPWGSHPLTDRLRSTEYLKVVHDGATMSRVGKTLQLAEVPAAQQHLRVCFQKTGDYNCCECVKCLRTMTTLHLAGALERFEVFPKALEVERLRTMELTRELLTIENLRLAEAVGNLEIAAALEHALAEFRKLKLLNAQAARAKAKAAAAAAAGIPDPPEAPPGKPAAKRSRSVAQNLPPRLRSLASRLRNAAR